MGASRITRLSGWSVSEAAFRRTRQTGAAPKGSPRRSVGLLRYDRLRLLDDDAVATLEGLSVMGRSYHTRLRIARGETGILRAIVRD